MINAIVLRHAWACAIGVLVIVMSSSAQQAASKRILDNEQSRMFSEGSLLYHLERVAWVGTDIVSAKLPEQRKQFGGYFVYPDSTAYTCIFYTAGAAPTVLASITFDSIDANSNHRLDSARRPLTALERDIHSIRTTTYNEFVADTLFKHYKNTGFNIIPIIDRIGRRVYIMTSPPDGVILFGNDYLLTFSDANQLLSKKRLHQSLIEHEYTKDAKHKGSVSALHTHAPETGDLMTATDMCTLMLYQRYTSWENYYIIGTESVNMWNCKRNSFMKVSREMFDKMMNDKGSK